jgi:hypothetical protein
MKCCKVKLKQMRSKEDKAGAQLGSETEKKLFSMLRLSALILFQNFVALKLANRWRARAAAQPT